MFERFISLSKFAQIGGKSICHFLRKENTT